MRFAACGDSAGFHVVLQGSCWLLLPDADPIALGAGDIAFLSRECGHGLADRPDTPLTGFAEGEQPPVRDGSRPSTVLLCGAYLLDRVRPHPLLAQLPDVIHLPARVGPHPSLRAAAELLGIELQRPRPGGGAVVSALLDMLLLYIIRAWLDEHASSGWAAALNDPAIAAALRAVHDEPARAWTVESLGAEAGLSRAAFSRRFAALVGQPPQVGRPRARSRPQLTATALDRGKAEHGRPRKWLWPT